MGLVGRRQSLIAAGALLAAPRIAQAPKKLPVLGIPSPHRKPTPEFIANNPLTNRMRKLSWVEGKTALHRNVCEPPSECGG